MKKTRLPSNLRPTTREGVHLVTRGHLRSRDKAELLPIEVVRCGNRKFRRFWSRDLDLDPI